MNNDSSVSQRIQDAFVYSVITDVKFLSIVRSSIKPRYFSSKITEDVVTICYEYYDQFHAAPGNHFHDELVRRLSNKDDETKKLYIEYLTKLQGEDPPNQDYIISRVNSFVKAREFEDAAVKFVQMTKNGKFDDARDLMYEALKVGVQKEEVGIKYLDMDIPSYLDDSNDSNEYLIPLGIKALDKRLPRGVRRTDSICILGNFKGGKSWFCSHLGIECLIRGKKVLHISHENSAEEVEMRYDMSLGAMRSYGGEYAEIEEIDEYGNTISKRKERVGSVFEPGASINIRHKVARFGGELIIKKYPMASCTMGEIRRYLDYLEMYVGFIPDLVINDYVEKMSLPTDDRRRNEINNINMQSKGLADERKFAWVTVSQSTRESQDRKFLSVKDFAEDIRKVGDVDLAIGISRTQEQLEQKRMQAMVLANRHGSMGFACGLATNFEIGQFCVDSWDITVHTNPTDEGEKIDNKDVEEEKKHLYYS